MLADLVDRVVVVVVVAVVVVVVVVVVSWWSSTMAASSDPVMDQGQNRRSRSRSQRTRMQSLPGFVGDTIEVEDGRVGSRSGKSGNSGDSGDSGKNADSGTWKGDSGKNGTWKRRFVCTCGLNIDLTRTTDKCHPRTTDKCRPILPVVDSQGSQTT